MSTTNHVAAAIGAVDPAVQVELIKHSADLAKALWSRIDSHSTDLVVQIINESSYELNFKKYSHWQGFFGICPTDTITPAVNKTHDPDNDTAIGGYDMWANLLDGCFGYCIYEYTIAGHTKYLVIGNFVYATSSRHMLLVKTHDANLFNKRYVPNLDDYIYHEIDKEGTRGGWTGSGQGLQWKVSNWTHKSSPQKTNLRLILTDQ